MHNWALEHLTPQSVILDAGCRDAVHLIRLVQASGATGSGVDPVERLVEAARLLGRDRTRVYALLRSGGLASDNQPFSERVLGLLEHPEELSRTRTRLVREPYRRGAAAAAASHARRAPSCPEACAPSRGCC